MIQLIFCGITWPDTFRIIEPGEQLNGKPLWGEEDFSALDTIFGDVSSIDRDVARFLRLPGVPENDDGSPLRIMHLRVDRDTDRQGLVVIRCGDSRSDGRIVGMTNKLRAICRVLLLRERWAYDGAEWFGQMRDSEAIAWLVGHGVSEADAPARLPDYRRLSVDLRQDKRPFAGVPV